MMARKWGEGEMPSLEERVAYLEGRFGDHAAAIDDLRNGMLEGRTDLRNGLSDVQTELAVVRGEVADVRTELRTGLTDVRTELRTGLTDVRTEMTGLRGEMVDLRGEINRRFEFLDQKVDRHFTWLVGIQVAALVAVVGALVGSYYK